jgi:hypothetical protein
MGEVTCLLTLCPIRSVFVKLDVVTAVFLKIVILLDVTPCGFKNRYRWFGGTCYYHLHSPTLKTEVVSSSERLISIKLHCVTKQVSLEML